MFRVVILFCIGVFLVSCVDSEKNTATIKKELIMVEPSEMANLMNEMYAFNESIKQQIISGELHNTYPKKFNDIHSAVLTDSTDRDASFELLSRRFLESEQSIFEAEKDELIPYYNTAINACIACHKTTCVGPIPRIKKLLIK